MFPSKRFQYVINFFHYKQELWGEIVLVKKILKVFQHINLHWSPTLSNVHIAKSEN